MRLFKETHGQDLTEYALMALFVAIATVAVVPGVAETIPTPITTKALRIIAGIAMVAVLAGIIRRRRNMFKEN